jgi:hypothetical protein
MIDLLDLIPDAKKPAGVTAWRQKMGFFCPAGLKDGKNDGSKSGRPRSRDCHHRL